MMKKLKIFLMLPCLLMLSGCWLMFIPVCIVAQCGSPKTKCYGTQGLCMDGRDAYIDGVYTPPESSLWEPVQSYQDAHKDCKEATLKDYPYTVCATRVLEVFKLCKVHPQWGEPVDKIGSFFKNINYNLRYSSDANVKERKDAIDCLKQNGLYRTTTIKYPSMYGAPHLMNSNEAARANESFMRYQQQQIRYSNSKVGVKFP